MCGGGGGGACAQEAIIILQSLLKWKHLVNDEPNMFFI